MRLAFLFLFLICLKLGLSSSQKSYDSKTADAELRFADGSTRKEKITYNRIAGTIQFPESLFDPHGSGSHMVVTLTLTDQDSLAIPELSFGTFTIPGFTLARNGNTYTSGLERSNVSYATLTITDRNDTDGDGVPELTDRELNSPAFSIPTNLRFSAQGTAGKTFNWSTTASNTRSFHGYSFARLPPGLTGNSNGVVDGTPSTPGTYWASVTASNSYESSSRGFNLFIFPPAITNLPFSDEFSAAHSPQNYLLVPPDRTNPANLVWTNGCLEYQSPADPRSYTDGNFVMAIPNLKLPLNQNWEIIVEARLPANTSVRYEGVGMALFPENPSLDLSSLTQWLSLELGQDGSGRYIFAVQGSNTVADAPYHPTRVTLAFQYQASSGILLGFFRDPAASGSPFTALTTNSLNPLDLGSLGNAWGLSNASTLRVALWGDAWNSNGVSSGRQNLANLSIRPGVSPQIARQPANLDLAPGENADFTVELENPGPVSYRWLKDGNPLFSTSGSYRIPLVQTNDQGEYSVVISNLFGSVTSAVARLGVVPKPFITTLPSLLNPTEGESAHLTVTVTGQGPFSYQWQREGESLSGATNSFLDLSNLGPSSAGLYSVVVTGQGGIVTNPVTLLGVTRPLPFRDDFSSPLPGWITPPGSAFRFTAALGVLAAESAPASTRPPVALPLTHPWIAEVDAVLTATNRSLGFSLHPDSAETWTYPLPANRLDLMLAPQGTGRILQLVGHSSQGTTNLQTVTSVPQELRLRFAYQPAPGRLQLFYRSRSLPEEGWTDLGTVPLQASSVTAGSGLASLWNLHTNTKLRLNLWTESP